MAEVVAVVAGESDVLPLHILARSPVAFSETVVEHTEQPHEHPKLNH